MKNNYFNKKLLRKGFLILAIFTLIVFLLQGNIAPAYAECKSAEGCNNPFYGATGKVCKYNDNLCEKEWLEYKESVGTKPLLIMQLYNPLSIFFMILLFMLNHKQYKNKENGKNKNNYKK